MDTIYTVLDILEISLVLCGGLAVLSRYTKWKWDDKFFSSAEKILGLIVTIASIIPKKSKGKKDGK